MPPLFRFLINRLITIPLTLLVMTMVLYGFVMLTPPKVRVEIFIPRSPMLDRMNDTQLERYYNLVIEKYHLNDPFPIQYGLWLGKMATGDWGYSPVIGDDVRAALLRRTPVTAELALYSLLLFMPLGLISGVIAGARHNEKTDTRFRAAAFIATSLPPFILALVLMAIFYVSLHWLAPERLSTPSMIEWTSGEFHTYTGFLTIDALLNGRQDLALEALQHLVMPVVTLSLLHWATLGRVTRASMIEELQKEYIIAAQARGIPPRRVTWRHAFRNVLTPALTSTALSAASLFGGVFIVEVIYNFRGVSDLVINSTREIPDAALLLGFGVYSVLVVLLLMFGLDVVMAALDPRIRAGVLES